MEIGPKIVFNLNTTYISMLLSLNQKIYSSIDQYPIGLLNGKMGICIYFYHLSRMENVVEYEKIADKILDTIIEEIPSNKFKNARSIIVSDGLAGIAVGISHLIKEKFLTGDINTVLDDIDDTIFNIIAFEENNFSNMFIQEKIYLLYYLYIRHDEQNTKDGKYIFSELIINIIESIYQQITPAFFDEPVSFSIYEYHLPAFLFIISKIMSLDIYNYRISKILYEFSIKISGSFPVRQSNQLFLLWGLLSISSYYNTLEITKLITLLKSNIDINHILYKELRDKRIFIHNGVSLIYILLLIIQKEFPKNAIEFDSQEIHKRIMKSEVWENTGKFPYGLLEGITGPLFISSFIKKSTNYEGKSE